MKARPRGPEQDDLLRPRLTDMIDLRHELVKLAALINWEFFEREWAGFFPSDKGRPATPSRLVAGLLYLQHAFKLSDEAVVARWVENPYYQHFTGETFVGKTVPRGLLKKSFSGRHRDRSDFAYVHDGTGQHYHGRRQLLEVHGGGGQQRLDLHVCEPPSDGCGKSVERLGRAVGAFDAPAVSGVDRMVVLAPCQAFASGAQDGRVVRDDMHPAGRCAVGQALRLEGATRAVVSVGAIPSPGFRAGPRGQQLPCRASDHIVTGIILEPLGGEPLRPLATGGAKGRDDGFYLAVLEGGVDAAHAIDQPLFEDVMPDPARTIGSVTRLEARVRLCRILCPGVVTP